MFRYFMSQKFDLELDISSARRVAIAAQGLNKAKPKIHKITGIAIEAYPKKR